jgi:hypothetical protein
MIEKEKTHHNYAHPSLLMQFSDKSSSELRVLCISGSTT